MGAFMLEMVHPAFIKGFTTAGKPEYNELMLKNDVELIVLARDLMRELNGKEDLDGDQFANKLGFLFGMFCNVSDGNVHLLKRVQQQPPTTEPPQFLQQS